MRRLPLLVLVVAALAGCGQSNPDLIPASNAQALQQTADKIQQACTDEDRSEARAQIRLAKREIDGLPRTVDAELKQNLQDWIDRIESRISDDCRAEATPTPTRRGDAHRGADRGARRRRRPRRRPRRPRRPPTEAPTRSAHRGPDGSADRGAAGDPDAAGEEG